MADVTVKALQDIPPYAGEHAIPSIRFRPAGQALGVSSWGMNVLELDPGSTDYPEHDHASDGHEEVYVLLTGSATLHADGEARALSRGDLVRVGPTTKRKFVAGSEGATLLALGGTPGQPYKPSMGG